MANITTNDEAEVSGEKSLIASSMGRHCSDEQIKALENNNFKSVFAIAGVFQEVFEAKMKDASGFGKNDTGRIYKTAVNIARQIIHNNDMQKHSAPQIKRNADATLMTRSVVLKETSTYKQLIEIDHTLTIPMVDENDIRANTAPSSYCCDLLHIINTLESPDSPFNMALRRPDVSSLILSQDNFYSEVAAIELVVKILESYILLKKPATHLNEEYFSLHFPHSFPFSYDFSKIRLHLDQKKIPFIEIINCARHTTESFENDTSIGLIINSGLFSEQIKTLTNISDDPSLSKLAVLIDQNIDIKLQELPQSSYTIPHMNIKELAGKLNCTENNIRELLFLTPFEISISPFQNSSFNNSPYLYSDDAGPAPKIELIEDQLTGLTPTRLLKMCHISRISRWYDITMEDAHQLLGAVSKTFEKKIGEDKFENIVEQSHLSKGSIELLGLFSYLRDRFSITIDNFCALVYAIPYWTTGQKQSLIDKKYTALLKKVKEQTLSYNGAQYVVKISSSAKSVPDELKKSFRFEVGYQAEGDFFSIKWGGDVGGSEPSIINYSIANYFNKKVSFNNEYYLSLDDKITWTAERLIPRSYFFDTSAVPSAKASLNVPFGAEINWQYENKELKGSLKFDGAITLAPGPDSSTLLEPSTDGINMTTAQIADALEKDPNEIQLILTAIGQSGVAVNNTPSVEFLSAINKPIVLFKLLGLDVEKGLNFLNLFSSVTSNSAMNKLLSRESSPTEKAEFIYHFVLFCEWAQNNAEIVTCVALNPGAGDNKKKKNDIVNAVLIATKSTGPDMIYTLANIFSEIQGKLSGLASNFEKEMIDVLKKTFVCTELESVIIDFVPAAKDDQVLIKLAGEILPSKKAWEDNQRETTEDDKKNLVGVLQKIIQSNRAKLIEKIKENLHFLPTLPSPPAAGAGSQSQKLERELSAILSVLKLKLNDFWLKLLVSKYNEEQPSKEIEMLLDNIFKIWALFCNVNKDNPELVVDIIVSEQIQQELQKMTGSIWYFAHWTSLLGRFKSKLDKILAYLKVSGEAASTSPEAAWLLLEDLYANSISHSDISLYFKGTLPKQISDLALVFPLLRLCMKSKLTVKGIIGFDTLNIESTRAEYEKVAIEIPE